MPEYHYILTAAHKHTPGHALRSGTLTPRPHQTRAGIFHDLITNLADATGATPDQLIPTFFHLEPNQL